MYIIYVNINAHKHTHAVQVAACTAMHFLHITTKCYSHWPFTCQFQHLANQNPFFNQISHTFSMGQQCNSL